jgi:hypothetical protein
LVAVMVRGLSARVAAWVRLSTRSLASIELTCGDKTNVTAGLVSKPFEVDVTCA